eukprot:18341-Rhodomonas_salina.6
MGHGEYWENGSWLGKTALKILYDFRGSSRAGADEGASIMMTDLGEAQEGAGSPASEKRDRDLPSDTQRSSEHDREAVSERSELLQLLRLMLQAGARPSEIVDKAISQRDWAVVRMVVTEESVGADDHKASASLTAALHSFLNRETEHPSALATLLAASWETTEARPQDRAGEGKRAAFVAGTGPSAENCLPLSLAVQKGWVRTTEALLKYECVLEAINAQDVFGFTALHHACMRLEKTLDVNTASKQIVDRGEAATLSR